MSQSEKDSEIEVKKMLSRIDNTHHLFHKLMKLINNKHKDLSNYELTVEIDEFVENHPEILSITCDDSMHMSSSIYLVPHRDRSNLFGYTLLYYGQDGNEAELFLYPSHIREFHKALSSIIKDMEEDKKVNEQS